MLNRAEAKALVRECIEEARQSKQQPNFTNPRGSNYYNLDPKWQNASETDIKKRLVDLGTERVGLEQQAQQLQSAQAQLRSIQMRLNSIFVETSALQHLYQSRQNRPRKHNIPTTQQSVQQPNTQPQPQPQAPFVPISHSLNPKQNPATTVSARTTPPTQQNVPVTPRPTKKRKPVKKSIGKQIKSWLKNLVKETIEEQKNK